MSRVLIVALSLAGTVFVAATSLATKMQMSPEDLKTYCNAKHGTFASWQSGAASCEIGSGKSKVTIDCTKDGQCNISRIMVSTRGAPAKVGVVGGAVSAAGNNSGAAAGKSAGNTSGAAAGKSAGNTNSAVVTKSPTTAGTPSVGNAGVGSASAVSALSTSGATTKKPSTGASVSGAAMSTGGRPAHRQN